MLLTPLILSAQVDSLSEKTKEVKAVTVKGKTQSEKITDQGYSVNVIDATPLQNRNMDASKALQQASGVRIRKDAGMGSSFNLTMNGLNAAQFINGIPLEVFGSAYRLNSIPINQIQQIEVYKGVVPVYLGGDALGGAINVVTKYKVRNNLNAAYSFGSFNTHIGSLNGFYRDSSTGITVLANGFLNYSDNNYSMRNMEIIENSYFVKKNVKRFNDRYLSYASKIEVGLTDKKYADALLVGFSYSGVKRDVQTGPLQYPATGDVTAGEINYQPYFIFRKTGLLRGNIDLNIFLLSNYNATHFSDTSSYSYQWDGSIASARPADSEFGELGEKQLYVANQSDFVQRYNISYNPHPAHTFSVNYVSNYSERKTRDELKPESSSVPGSYSKSILGIGYDSKLFSKRLQTSLFAKFYHYRARIENAVSWEGGYFRSNALQTKEQYQGAGAGSSFSFSKRFLIKASIEYAYRIPYSYELMGDGINAVANVNLRPESTLNYNTGYSLKCLTSPAITLTWNSYGFIRNATDFIRAIPGNRRLVYTNFSKVLVRGVESEIYSSIKKKLMIRLNASYQQVLDNSEFVGNTKIENYTYLQQLPNTPRLFGNVDLSYNLLNIWRNKFCISPFYSFLYVKEFYLGFENVAKGGEKFVIPTQMVHDLGLTFSSATSPLALSVECSNLTDTPAYDNFRLQKPGRAFSIKVTYTISKQNI